MLNLGQQAYAADLGEASQRSQTATENNSELDQLCDASVYRSLCELRHDN